jgi:hypothetical protein
MRVSRSGNFFSKEKLVEITATQDKIRNAIFTSFSHNFYVFVRNCRLHITALCCAGILEQSMRARNRVGIVLSYWHARLHRLAES